MRGYVTRKRDRYYAVIYEGLDPVTGRNAASGTPPAQIGPRRNGSPPTSPRNATDATDEVRALTFGAYLTRQWLPGKQLTLATSTYRGYVHKTERHILPALGTTRLRGFDRSPRSNIRPGPPRNCRCSCGPPPVTACSRPCGCQPRAACDAASCLACVGPTSTSKRQPCRSTVRLLPSATSSTSHAGRPTTHGAASTSTPPPSPSYAAGAP
jgi:hypothetical protein